LIILDLGGGIIFDYNKDGKIDYKDQLTEMMIINKQQEKEDQVSNNMDSLNNKSNLGCCFFFVIIVLAITCTSLR
jgi:hypothetical protein